MFTLNLESHKQLHNKQLTNILFNVTELTVLQNLVHQDNLRQFAQLLGKLTHLQKLGLQLFKQQSQSSTFQIYQALENLTNLTEFELQVWNPFNLETEEARQLGKSLKKLTNLTKFSICIDGSDLESDQIGVCINKGISTLTKLQHMSIDLFSTNIQSMAPLMSGIENLTTLNFKIGDGSLSSEGCKEWSKYISRLTNLTYLKIEIENVLKESGEGFGEIFSCLHKLLKLQSLILDIIELNYTVKDMEQLKLSLCQLSELKYFFLKLKFNDKRKILNLDYNPIMILDGLEQNNHPVLETVELTLPVYDPIDKCYFEKLGYIKKLDLTLDIFQLSQSSIKSLFLGMRALANLTNLSAVFQIKNTDLSQEIVREFGKSLKRMTKLEEFEIKFPKNLKIKLGGAVKLGRGLSQLSNLKKLSLTIESQNFLGEEGLNAIGMAMKKLNNLEELKFKLDYNNKITKHGIKNLFSGVSFLVCLIKLDLEISFDRGEEFEVTSISNGLESLYQLQELKLDIPIGENGKNFAASFSQLISIKNIDLHLKTVEDNNIVVWILQNLRESNIEKVNIELDEYNRKRISLISVLEEILPIKSLFHLNLDVPLSTSMKKMNELKGILKKINNLKSINFSMGDFVENMNISSLLRKYIKGLVRSKISSADDGYNEDIEEDDFDEEESYDSEEMDHANRNFHLKYSMF